MPRCRLSIRTESGAVRAETGWDTQSILVFSDTYMPGDYILMEADTPGCFWDIRLDDTMLPATVFVRDTALRFPIPFDQQKVPYSPKSFLENCHMTTAKAAGDDQIYARRNLALNPYDAPGMEGCYPHASDNIGPREDTIFIPRNAIDGIYANAYHWDYPYQSWGINRDPGAALKIDLGVPCRVDEIRLTLRADFPHDNYWVRASLDFSDGSTKTVSLEKSALPQVFGFDTKCVQWVTLHTLIPSDEPSPFPALTQIQIWDVWRDDRCSLIIYEWRIAVEQYCVGIDLGGTNIKTAVFTMDYEKKGEIRIPTKAQLWPEAVLGRMRKSVIDLCDTAHIESKQIRCIGIGVPGLLDIKNGISKFSPNFPLWEDVPVVDWFVSQLQIPTFIDNDVRVNLYGEWRYGAAVGKRNVVLLTLGTGLGAGIVVDGHVLYGATGSAGEIGHMNMYRNGRGCRCRSSGCLGRYVSALGMVRTLKEKLQAGADSVILQWVNHDFDTITAKMISEAYDQGDPAAIDTMHETGEILGYGLVNIINLYNPEMIVIGGGMSAAGERLLAQARAIVNTHALEMSRNACTIVTGALGDSAGMLGAAIYAGEKIKTVNSTEKGYIYGK